MIATRAMIRTGTDGGDSWWVRTRRTTARARASRREIFSFSPPDGPSLSLYVVRVPCTHTVFFFLHYVRTRPPVW